MNPTDTIAWSDHPLDLAAAARDLWPGGTLDFVQGRSSTGPERVCWPEDDAQVAQVFAEAAAAGQVVVPYGGGSGVCGGARSGSGAVALDTKRLARIGPLDAERWTVDCEAGVIGQHLEDWLAARGFVLGNSPSSIGCSTVGGWAASRGAGQFSSKYGVFEDMILRLEGVAPGHGRFVVGEGGDAPDAWMPLLLGSEGTLAVITRLRLRVWPAPAKRWLRGYRFRSLEQALTAMRRLAQGELWPAVVRLYDPVDTRIGGRTSPKGHKSGGDPGWLSTWMRRLPHEHLSRRALALPLALPHLANALLDRASSDCLLILGFEGDAEVVERTSAEGHELCLAAGGDDLGAEPGERWYASRHAVSYKLMPIFAAGGYADTMEVAARWSDVLPTYHAVRAAVRDDAVVMAHLSHVYPEGAAIYFSFAGPGDRRRYNALWERALAAALAAGATTTHHHGVGTLKARAVSAELGPAAAGWRALKAELDPNGLLNPGRVFVDGVEPAVVSHREPLADDGLVVCDGRGPLPEAARWRWEHLPAPPRWQRSPWHTGWGEVAGAVDGQRCRLGRGPRSAAGPDLRGWLFAHDPLATCLVASEAEASRWLGAARVEHPWRAARALLRSDLRPAVLAVQAGELLVGFRGPAAQALGLLASERVPGGLSERPWQNPARATGPLEACGDDDLAAVSVTAQSAWRRAE